ncbi:MAG: 50S ribosomal protein L6 [Clostridia bacterium]|nr:50S ribosomal protein L6 [Clostridia bacterium]MBN2884015.1 50S ribosomal protein L6 [Clostridia bacterium]
MSRIGKMPIDIPKGVDVKIEEGNKVTVKGPKGTMEQTFSSDMLIKIEENQVIIERPSDLKRHKAFHGLTRSLLNNMVVGVSEGFEKKLEINGVGYRAQLQGTNLLLSLGYSHPIEMIPPKGITVEVPAQTQIIVKGYDKQAVGEFAAEIRAKRKPEPYLGKGVKYADEKIRRKEGKTGSV